MPRPLRVQYAGAIYHVTARGNARQAIFLDDHDRRRFLGRLKESVESYAIRLYLLCLMPNHYHLVLETPQANLSRFMQSLETGYAVYFNRRHRRVGHLTQGRFKATLVEKNEYLLQLSRYVHLNPGFTQRLKKQPLKERIHVVRSYPWSSYGSYIGRSAPLPYVDYAPVLAQMGGRKAVQRRRYRQFVESALAQTDDAFTSIMKAAPLSIGTKSFDAWVQEQYSDLRSKSVTPEDVYFKRVRRPADTDAVLRVVSTHFGAARDDLCRRRRGCTERAVLAWMLKRATDMSNRQIADFLGLNSGAAVSYQMGRAWALMEADPGLAQAVGRMDRRLSRRPGMGPG